MTKASTLRKGQSGKQPTVDFSRRSAGVLAHVTSLPGPFGIGDLGPAARRWVDTLARARQTWWQILPLNPPGNGASPYQSFSAFAGNPQLVSPEDLFHDGLLSRKDIRPAGLPEKFVNYAAAARFKANILGIAWSSFRDGKAAGLGNDFDAFQTQQADWLADYALFMALHQAQGKKVWTDWPGPLASRDPGALREARRALRADIDRLAFEQFLFSVSSRPCAPTRSGAASA